MALLNKHKKFFAEAYKGSDIVGWWGGIERQLVGMLDRYEQDKSYTEADKVRTFLEVWRGHKLTGSISAEDVQALADGSSILAVDKWKAADYFSSLRDSLRKIQASEEELPRIGPPQELKKFKGSSAPRTLGSQFGPEKNAQATGNQAPTEEPELKKETVPKQITTLSALQLQLQIQPQ